MLLNWSKENQLLAEYSGCGEEIRPQTRDVSSSAEQLVKFCGRRAGVTSWRVGWKPFRGNASCWNADEGAEEHQRNPRRGGHVKEEGKLPGV